MKKIKISAIAIALLILTACADSQTNNRETTQATVADGQRVDETVGTPQIIEDMEDLDDEIDNRLLQLWREFDGIALVDLATGETVAENIFAIEDDQVVENVFEFAEGYYGAIVIDGVDINKDADGNVWGWSSTGEGGAVFFLFDSELNILEETRITDERLAQTWSRIAKLQDGDVIMYYFDTGWEAGLYSYNLTTHETTLLDIGLDEDIWISRLVLTETPNQLAFIGSRINDENHIYLGTINLENNSIQHTHTAFQYNEVIISGNFFILTESFMPVFMGGTPQGEMMLINMTTHEQYLLQVGTDESLRGMVVANRYLLTGTHEQIRLYDIATNEIVLERQPAAEMLPLVESSIGPNGENIDGVYPHIREFLRLRQDVYAVVFDIGDGTLHTEFIVIE